MKRIRKIGLTNFIFLIASLILVIILIAFSFTKNAASAKEIAHSWEVKNDIRRISSSISTMESQKLAYIYTRQIKYKHAFMASYAEYDSLMEVLGTLVDDNQAQVERLQNVSEIVDRNFSEFSEALMDDATSKLASVEEGKTEMLYAREIHVQLDEMLREENRLLDERNNSYDIWTFFIIVGIITATVIVIFSLYRLIKKVRPLVEELLETQENLVAANQNLNQTLEKLHKSNLEKEKEITAREQAMRETEKLNEVLSAKNQQLDHFAYVASHDLQEPLRTVSNYLEIFQEDFPERLEGEATMYFDFINSAVDRMRNLISGLLSFSRLGTSGEVEQIDLNETIQKIREDFSAVIEERDITIESDVLPTIEGYRIEIKQLFQNLISNAIKFTDSQVAPHIRITFEETGNYFNFHIQDNGIGIPDKDFAKIFDMFSRLHSTKDYEGQGIGLAFCKKIVELHHGNIWVSSQQGNGSTIHFTIRK